MPATLKQRAYRHLRERIILGQLGPGEHITEARVSRALKISRGPIREALRQLTSEGLIDFTPHSGARVRSPNRQELDELADLRASIESGIAARAAERVTAEQIEDLESTFKRIVGIAHQVRDAGMQHFDETTACEVTRLDLQFHGILMEAASSPRATAMVLNLGVLSFLWSQHRPDLVWGALHQTCVVIREHYRVLKAVRRRDPEAARAAMLEHLLSSKRFYRRLISSATPRLGNDGPEAHYSQAVRQIVAQFERQTLGDGEMGARWE